MSCTTNIIGVTDSTTLPFYDDLPEQLQTDIAVSESGLFMDKLSGGIDLMTIDDAEYMQDVLQWGLDAKNEAEKILKDELLITINGRFQSAKPKYIGEIGRRAFSSNDISSGTLVGHRYRSYEPIAGSIKISKIEIAMNGIGTFDIKIARCPTRSRYIEESDVLYTLPVTSATGSWVEVPQGDGVIELPLQINGVEQEYYIYYDKSTTGGLVGKNNEIKCSTCSGVAQSRAIDGFIEARGVSFSSINNLNNASSNTFGHGLIVTCVIGCENEKIVCREYEKRDAVSIMMQHAARFKAGELWIEYIFKSAYVNRTGLQNREYLWGKRNHFRAEFDKRISAIVDQMSIGETNCYECKEDKVVRKTIMVTGNKNSRYGRH